MLRRSYVTLEGSVVSLPCKSCLVIFEVAYMQPHVHAALVRFQNGNSMEHQICTFTYIISLYKSEQRRGSEGCWLCGEWWQLMPDSDGGDRKQNMLWYTCTELLCAGRMMVR